MTCAFRNCGGVYRIHVPDIAGRGMLEMRVFWEDIFDRRDAEAQRESREPQRYRPIRPMIFPPLLHTNPVIKNDQHCRRVVGEGRMPARPTICFVRWKSRLRGEVNAALDR